MSTPERKPASPRLAILGAGPIGLEAALAAVDHRLPFTLFEQAGSPAGNVRSWGHVQLFTEWPMNVSRRMRRWLAAAGRAIPATGCPTGQELADLLLDPLAALPEVAPHLRLSTRVLAIGREGLLKPEAIATEARRAAPFRLLLEHQGGEEVVQAEVVLDCTGTFGQPNALGDGGIPAPGERACEPRIVRFLPDFAAEDAAWAGQRILLVGAGHSAQTAAPELAALAARHPDTEVAWVLRAASPRFATDGDPLPERARLAADADALVAGASPAVRAITGVVVDALEETAAGVVVTLRERHGEARQRLVVDRLLSLTGGVGDHLLYRELQVHECYATSGPMKLAAALLGSSSSDCLAQASHGAETLVTPEPRFFLLGAKSYGRNTAFLLRTGYEQVDEVFGLLAGRPS